jgi:hypothetical protein
MYEILLLQIQLLLLFILLRNLFIFLRLNIQHNIFHENSHYSFLKKYILHINFYKSYNLLIFFVLDINTSFFQL